VPAVPLQPAAASARGAARQGTAASYLASFSPSAVGTCAGDSFVNTGVLPDVCAGQPRFTSIRTTNHQAVSVLINKLLRPTGLLSVIREKHQ
jgi:hypothetical protein